MTFPTPDLLSGAGAGSAARFHAGLLRHPGAPPGRGAQGPGRPERAPSANSTWRSPAPARRLRALKAAAGEAAQTLDERLKRARLHIDELSVLTASGERIAKRMESAAANSARRARKFPTCPCRPPPFSAAWKGPCNDPVLKTRHFSVCCPACRGAGRRRAGAEDHRPGA